MFRRAPPRAAQRQGAGPGRRDADGRAGLDRDGRDLCCPGDTSFPGAAALRAPLRCSHSLAAAQLAAARLRQRSPPTSRHASLLDAAQESPSAPPSNAGQSGRVREDFLRPGVPSSAAARGRVPRPVEIPFTPLTHRDTARRTLVPIDKVRPYQARMLLKRGQREADRRQPAIS